MIFDADNTTDDRKEISLDFLKYISPFIYDVNNFWLVPHFWFHSYFYKY